MIKYKVETVDNFLDRDDFESLCKLKVDTEINSGTKVYHNVIKNNKVDGRRIVNNR